MREQQVSSARVYVETYGCSFNVSDGEVMIGLLEREGFTIADSPESADAVIVNSCTVKDRTWLELKKRMEYLGNQSAAVILAGCAPRIPSQSQQLSRWSQVGPNNIVDLPEVVRRTMAGDRLVRTDVRHDESRLQLPTRRRNTLIEILPISKGCLGSCTFCQTVIARGRLKSFPEAQIIEKISTAVSDGVNQVWLTSQDCGAYGLDADTNLPALMRRIAELPGDFIVRIGMANPDLIKLYLDEFADALAHPRFYQFAHIPLQSGSDTVLADMRRMYQVEDFKTICARLRQISPDVTIATDIIVGFPTETDDDFQKTLTAVSEARIPVINRSRFSPRPGTPAAKMTQLPSKIVASRSRALYSLACDIAFADLDKWTNWRGPVAMEESLGGRNAVLARNYAYKPIVVSDSQASRGLARVSRRERFHLHGELITTN